MPTPKVPGGMGRDPHNLLAGSPRVPAHCALQQGAGNKKEGANHDQKLVAG